MFRIARIVLLCSLALSVWAASPAGGSAAAKPACQGGSQLKGGVSVHVYCGQAKATLRLAGRTYRFAPGRCLRTKSAFLVDTGIVTLLKKKPKFRYFGLAVVATRKGTYRNAVVRWQFPGRDVIVPKITVTLARFLREGTFSGRLPKGGGAVSGSFRCRT